MYLNLYIENGVVPVIEFQVADVNMLTGMKSEREEEGGSMVFCKRFTCLHHCISGVKNPRARGEILQILLENSADYNLRNDHGFNALQMALTEVDTDSVTMLVRYGCVGNHLTSSVCSPLAIMMQMLDVEQTSTSVSLMLRTLVHGRI